MRLVIASGLFTLSLPASALTIQENESYSLSIARNISGNGSVVIGGYLDADIGADFETGFIDYGSFKWSPQGGWANLGSLNSGVGSTPIALNYSGDLVVGWAVDGASSGIAYNQPTNLSLAAVISPNGTISLPLPTEFSGEVEHAFRWTKSEGMVGLGDLTGGEEFTYYNVNQYYSSSTLDGLTLLNPLSTVSLFQNVVSLELLEPIDTIGALIILNDGFTPAPYSDFTGTEDQYRSYINDNSHIEVFSSATGVSNDGRVIVGHVGQPLILSNNSVVLLGEAGHSYLQQSFLNGAMAFRWTEAQGMRNLGGLVTGGGSAAHGVSGDGSVVVGSASSVAFFNANNLTSLGDLVLNGSENAPPFTSYIKAVRWTEEDGIAALGGVDSSAIAASYDGSVIVGDMSVDNGYHAFRWTQDSGMVDLGVLGSYGTSTATDVNHDGSVVVGNSGYLSAIANYEELSIELTTGQRGFRWTETSGIQSINEWLTDNNVAVGDSVAISAGGVSDDGQTVVGILDTYEAYVARVSSFGSGLFKLKDLNESVATTAANISGSLRTSGVTINGAHSRPMSRRVDTGKQTMWLAGDWGRDRHNGRDGDNGLAEIGGGYNFGFAQLNISLGKTWSEQNSQLGGHVDIDGTYLMVESILPLSSFSGLYATVGLYSHWGDADIRRGYFNVGLPDSSSGDSDTYTWGLRARLDWEDAYSVSTIALSPYVDLSYSDTHMDSYTETGGGAPAQFDSRNDDVTEIRLGLNGAMPLANTTMALVSNIEVAHRFENQGAGTSGQLLGLFEFDIDGQEFDSTWVKAGIGLEGKLGAGKALLMLNGTTEGEMLSSWIAASYQLEF